jgi:hypothetical protein
MAFGSKRLGRAILEMSLDDKTQKGLSGVSQNIQSVAKVAGAVAVALGATVAATFTAASLKAQSLADSLDNISKKTQLSTSFLQTLKVAAERSGVGFEQATKSVSQLANQLFQGSSTAKRGLDVLGLEFDQLKALAPEEQFTLIAERINALPAGTDKAGAAMALFGAKGGANLLAIAQNLEYARERVAALGLELSGPAVAASDKLEDSFTDVRDAIGGFLLQLGGAINQSEVYQDLVDRVASSIGNLNNWIKENTGTITTWTNTAIFTAMNTLSGFLKLIGHTISAMASLNIATLSLVKTTVTYSSILAKFIPGLSSIRRGVLDGMGSVIELNENLKIAGDAAIEGAEGIDLLVQELVDGSGKAGEFGVAVGKGGATGDVDDLGDAVEKATEKLNAMAFAFDLSKERAKELADFNKQAMSQIAAFQVPEAPGGQFDVPAGTRGIFNVGRNIPTLESFGPIIGGIEDASRATTDWSKQLEDVANIMRVMGIEADSAFAVIVGGFIASSKAAADYEAAVSNVDKALALATGAAVVWQQAGQEGAKGVASSAASGAQLGFSVAGPWGAAAGAAAGAIIALIRNSGRTAKTVAEEVGRDLGQSLSDGLIERIHESGKNVQLFLSEMFAEGGAGAFGREGSAFGLEGIDRFAEEIGDIFSVLEQGNISADEALIAFTSDVSILMEHLRELGAGGQEQIDRIIAAAREAGPEFAAIADELERVGQRAKFAANTVEEIASELGISREAARELAEVWGVDVVNNFRAAAIEAGLTNEQIRALRDHARESGVSVTELVRQAQALGIPLGAMAEKILGVEGGAESTGDEMEHVASVTELAAAWAKEFADELARARQNAGQINLPSLGLTDGFVPDVSAQGGFFSPAIPRDLTIRAHRGERVDIGPSGEGGEKLPDVHVHFHGPVSDRDVFERIAIQAVDKAIRPSRNTGGLSSRLGSR